MSSQGVNPYNLQQQYMTNKAFGMNAVPQSVSTPMGAQIDKQTLVNAASDNFIGDRITAFDEINPATQLAVALPATVAINTAMDKYLKLYDGDYAKSFPGKLGNWGDKVSESFSNSKVGKFFGRIKSKVSPYTNRIYKNSAILRALNETPSSPELELVKKQMNMGKDFSLSSYHEFAQKFIKEPIKCAQDLDILGADKATIDRVENLLKNAPAEERANILLEEQYKLLKPDALKAEIDGFLGNAQRGKILQNLKANALKYTNSEEFELLMQDTSKNFKEIYDKILHTDPKYNAKIWWSDKNMFTKIKGFLFGRKETIPQMRNIITSSLGTENTMHRTALGRTLPKIWNLLMEGSTGRMFMGKLSTLMQGWFLAEALVMASRQETTADKIRSFAERITELIGFLIFIPPSIKLMHKIGGLKNWGMTPDQVKAYEAAKLEHNMKKAQGLFANKKAAKADLKAVEAMKPKAKNPISWLARKLGQFITTGDKTTTRPYSMFRHKDVDMCVTELMKNPVQYFKNIPHRLKDIACNPKYWFKRAAGWPIRFAIPMLVIIPFFNKIMVKGVHALIGKPKYSLLDESKVEEHNQKVEELENMKNQPDTQQNSQPLDTEKLPDTNLIKQTINGQNINTPNGTVTNTTAATQTVTNPTTDTQGRLQEPVRTYIPSPASNIQGLDPSRANMALANADIAEQEIANIIASVRKS